MAKKRCGQTNLHSTGQCTFPFQTDDPVFCEAAKQEEFDIRLICQPPNSPDFNILDLSFFKLFKQFNTRRMQKQ
jgi:hypothetical protein